MFLGFMLLLGAFLSYVGPQDTDVRGRSQWRSVATARAQYSQKGVVCCGTSNIAVMFLFVVS
jgi:hypothetical protein